LTRRPRRVRAFNALVGERVRRHGLRGCLEQGRDSLEEWDPSSEAEIRSKDETPERGEGSPEGLRPTSEAEVCSRGAAPSSGVGVL
jgi:hypothetical protein